MEGIGRGERGRREEMGREGDVSGREGEGEGSGGRGVERGGRDGKR